MAMKHPYPTRRQKLRWAQLQSLRPLRLPYRAMPARLWQLLVCLLPLAPLPLTAGAQTTPGATASAATTAARPGVLPAAGPGALPAPARVSPTALGCLIEASAVAEVGTPVIGIIDSVLVERGDTVKRGQVLAQHENRIERAAVTLAEQKVANNAELRAAKTQINFAHKKAQRTAQLTELNFVSSQVLDQAQTESTMARMRLAQAVEQQELALKELEMARAQLAQRTITSPLNGVVVDRLVSPGERVENRPVFKVAQIDPLRVEVVLPAALFGQIKVGSTARVTPELPGSPAREARVAIVDRVVDAGSNTFRARLTLPNPNAQLPPGLRCRVSFDE
ncbi:MAG: efflux RND transporter periplasmic adaptor subunit [Rubrivivax sp.]|jgi:RND family efflux transporter MFP subunit|nr:efflux RND transporter periplasmic adaptor subunit [Rubrivivax sp.]